jgi:hypothetical protein
VYLSTTTHAASFEFLISEQIHFMIDRMAEAAKSNHDWNNEAEKSDVLEQLSRAHKVYEGLGRGTSNVDWVGLWD